MIVAAHLTSLNETTLILLSTEEMEQLQTQILQSWSKVPCTLVYF